MEGNYLSRSFFQKIESLKNQKILILYVFLTCFTRTLISFFIIFCLWNFNLQATASVSILPDFRLAFGSCAKDREPQPIWFDILNKQPDLFLFIGDNQYADIKIDSDGNRTMSAVTNKDDFANAYVRLGKHEGFAQLKRTVPILATWDDHDYGQNDAGREFGLKDESQQAFMDFFDYPEDHPIRTRQGVYNQTLIESKGKKIQVLLLDTRYHRDRLDLKPEGRVNGKGPYVKTTDTQRSLLGDEQWDWLKSELQKPADIRLIASSIQVVANEHGWESWGNMPHERQRLYELLNQTNANGVVFLSGDRHLMEVSRDDGSFDMAVPYPLWDFTSSGINQSYREVDEVNQYRIGEPVRDSHYATIDIHWAENLLDSQIVFTALGLNNRVLQTNTIKLAELQHLN